MNTKHSRDRDGRRLRRSLAMSCTLLFIFILGPAWLALDPCWAFENDQREWIRGAKACTRSSNSALKACKNEIKDDYWIAIGNCKNIADPNRRSQCREDAVVALSESREMCHTQLDARLEVCAELGEDRYDPDIDPQEFVDPETITETTANAFLPLVPGMQWVYRGETDEGVEIITLTVTDEVKKIEYPLGSGMNFRCAVIHDQVTIEGELIEDTVDWFAQDSDGNVWYFGEISKNYEDGELVDLEGSWKAGRDYAKPGIIMLADPQSGDYYRQEFALGNAEDMATVVNRGIEAVTVAFGSFSDDVLKNGEFTPIDPDVFEYKYYAHGIGKVLEVNTETGERLELLEMKRP